MGAEISGRVDAVNVDYNSPVRKGQVLAVINTGRKRRWFQTAHAQRAHPSAADERVRRRDGGKHKIQPPAHQIGHEGARAFVGHMRQLQTGGIGEHFRHQMIARSIADRAIVQRARLCLRQRNQVFGRVQRGTRLHHQHRRHDGDQADRRKILFRVIRQLLEQDRIGRQIGGRHENGIAVRLRPRHQRKRRQPRAAAAIVDHDRLPEIRGNGRRDHARQHVGAAALAGDAAVAVLGHRHPGAGVGLLRCRLPCPLDLARRRRTQIAVAKARRRLRAHEILARRETEEAVVAALIRARWPDFTKLKADAAADAEMNWVIAVVTQIRTLQLTQLRQ